MSIPTSDRQNSRFITIAHFGSMIVFLVGSLAFIGWIFDIDILKSVLPGTVSMKANTALCFMMAGISLWLGVTAGSTRTHRLQQACGIIVSLIGLLTLSQYLFGWNCGIDQLLFKDPINDGFTLFPGRMAPNTALNFSLLGIGLLFLDWETHSGRHPAQFFIIPASIISLLGLVGYFYGAAGFYRLLNYTPMAINTVVAFSILCIAMLISRPDAGPMGIITKSGIGGHMARRLLPVVFIATIALGWLGLEGENVGLYDYKLGLSLVVIAILIFVTSMILVVARTLNLIDSERLRFEQELNQTISNLERIVIERTQKLTISESFYRSLTENSLVGVFQISLKGEILFANRTLVCMLGFDSLEAYTSEDMLARYRTPFDNQDFLERLARDGKVEAFETVLLTRNDEPRDVLISANLYSDHIIGNLIDITERNQMEKELHESAEKFQLFVKNVKDYSIIMLDPQGRIINWNLGAEKIMGFQADEIIGEHFSRLYTKEDIRADEPAQLLKASKDQGKVITECLHMRKDGTHFYAEVIMNSVYDKNGTLSGFAKITRDITEIRRVQNKIAASEIRFRRLFEAARDGILILDAATGRILDANPFMEEILGYSYEQLLEKHLWELGFLEDIVVNKANFLELQQKAYVRYENIPIETVKGEKIEVEFVSNSYLMGDEKVMQCNIRDISERKQLEQSQIAKTVAESANRAKSEFLSRMSHELRTPLNSVLGFTQLLLMDELTPDQTSSLGQILKSGRHLLDLINEVLDISRIEAGNMNISTEPIRLVDTVQSAIELIRPLAEQRGISIMTRIPSSRDIFVTADERRLKQVMLNLLSNAVKYNRESGAIVVAVDLQIDGYLHITVQDTGEGIPPEKMGRLFAPFDRLGLEPGKVEGTGLGLALSKGIVEAMGGRIGAESVVGEGSCFWLDLQLSMIQKEEIVLAIIEEYIKENPLRKKGLVLYVEDNPSNIQLIEKVLARLPSVDLITAMQGSIGLDMAQVHKPTLILLDLHLPDMHGEKVLEQLRAIPETKDIPVIIMSADATKGQVDHMLSAGATAYLTKPIDVREFLNIVGEMMEVIK